MESIKPLKTFTYQVIAQGKIIRAETVAVPDREYHVIEFPSTFEMAPSAKLIVYHFKNDEIQSATTQIDLREMLSNYLKVKLATPRAKPGSTLDIEVNTNPHSYVGLLGVAQSVLLAKENKELNKDDAFNEIERYRNEVHEKSGDNVYKPTPYYTNNYLRDFSVGLKLAYHYKHTIRNF